MKVAHLIIALACLTASSLLGSFFVDLLPEANDSMLSIDLISSDEDSVVIEFELPGFFYDTLTFENTRWEKISIKTHSSEAESCGLPALPRITVSCHIPEGAEVTMDVSGVEDTTLEDFDVYPMQYEFDTLGEFHYDSTAYDGDVYWDEPIVQKGSGAWRKLNYYTFDYYPIEYRTDGDSLVVTRKARVKLSFSGGVPGKVNPDRFFETAYENALLNFNQVGDNGRSIPADSKGKVLIVTPDSLYESVEKLADWRQREGYWVKLTSTSEIPGGSANYVDSISLYNYLHQVNQAETLSYVVLVGRQDNIPWHDCTYHWVGTRNAISDLSYCYSDSCGFPEFFLGRIPLTTNELVGGYADSIIEFETTLFDTVGESIYNSILITAGLGRGTGSDPLYRFYCVAENYGFLDTLLTTFSSEEIEYLAEVDGSERDDDPNRIEIKKRLRDPGMFFVSNFSHGSQVTWFMNGESGTFASTDILPNPSISTGTDTLYVDNRLSFARGYACRTAEWAFEPYPEWCIGTAWMKQIGLGYFGETAEQNWGEPNTFVREEAELIAHGDVYCWGQIYNSLISACYPLSGTADWGDSSFALSKQFIGDPGVHIYRKNDSLPNDPFNITLDINTRSFDDIYSFEVFYLCSAEVAQNCTVFVDNSVDTSFYSSRDVRICISGGFVDSSAVHCETIETDGINNYVVFDTSEIPVKPDVCGEYETVHVTLSGTGFITKDNEFYIALNDTCPPPPSDSITLYNGWNLVSVPFETGYYTLGEIFGTDTIYKYDQSTGGYVSADTIIPEKGYSYWVYSSVDTSIRFMFGYDDYDREINEGWNFIGSISTDTTWAGNYCCKTVDDSIFHMSPKFRWHRGEYYWDDDVIAGVGYTVLSLNNGNLSFPGACDSTSSDSSRFKLTAFRTLLNSPDMDGGAVPEDSLYFDFDIDWTNDKVLVMDKNTGDTLENILVAFQVGDSIDIQYTDTAGSQNWGYAESDLDIGNNDSTWILMFKPGYVEAIVHPFGVIENSDTLWGDVHINGDIIVGVSSSLIILAGTDLYLKPGTSDWNWTYDYNDKTEILAYRGNISVEGEPDNIVHFHPASGGSGMYQWAGLYAKELGSFDVRWAQFDSCDGVGAVQGGHGSGNCKLVHTTHTGNQGVFGDWRGLPSHNSWFQMDSCNVIGRICWFNSADSSWARACSVKGSPSVGESYYIDTCLTELKIENCYFYDYTAQAGRLYGNTEFRGCDFDGTDAASYIYDEGADFYDCDIKANGGDYGLYVGTEANEKCLDVDSTTFVGAGIAAVRTTKSVEFKKYNCFIKDKGSYTFYSRFKVKIATDSCYFDSLVVGGYIMLDTLNNLAECIPDTSLSKIYSENGRPIRPTKYSLGNAVPNPFNSSVSIEIDIPKSTKVTFEIYNMLGKRVITLMDQKLDCGRYKLVWDGKDHSGNPMPSGTYLYRIKTEDYEQTQKMTLIK